MVVKEKCLRASLALVVATANADRIDVAPIGFNLWVNGRIAVNLRGACLKNFGAQPLGETKHIDGTMHASLGGLYRVVLVMNGTRRTGQIVNLINFDVQRKRDVVTHQLKALMSDEVVNVSLGSCEEVIQTDDVVPVRQQAITKVAAKKACAARNKNSFRCVVVAHKNNIAADATTAPWAIWLHSLV